MRQSFDEFLYILARSRRTQWAIALGVVFFIGIHLWGNYALSNFELHGPMKWLEETFVQKFAKRYDKVALFALLSFWVLAYQCYQKDKKRFW